MVKIREKTLGQVDISPHAFKWTGLARKLGYHAGSEKTRRMMLSDNNYAIRQQAVHYHEAGHAAMAFATGTALLSVSCNYLVDRKLAIRSVYGSSKRTKLNLKAANRSKIKRARTNDALIAYMQTLIAGRMAEWKFLSSQGKVNLFGLEPLVSDSDMYKANQIVSLFDSHGFLTSKRAFLAAVRKSVALFLDLPQMWAAIEQIVELLNQGVGMRIIRSTRRLHESYSVIRRARVKKIMQQHGLYYGICTRNGKPYFSPIN